MVSAESFDELSAREQEILNAAAPLIQTRIQMLRECRDMLGFLFVSDDDLVVDDKALAKPQGVGRRRAGCGHQRPGGARP